jgi:hypothetical protein
MEATIKIVKFDTFQFGANKEKTGYNITEAEGRKFTTFSDTQAAYLQEGMERVIEYDSTVNKAGYPQLTISKVKDNDGNWVESSKQTGYRKGMPTKDSESIERQVALKCACERSEGAKTTPEILREAEEFARFLHARAGGQNADS